MKYLILLMSVLSAFLFIPLQLYYTNIIDWGYDFSLVNVTLFIGLVVFLFCLILYFVIKNISVQWSYKYIALVFLSGMAIILNDVLSPLELGVLDGTNRQVNSSLKFIIIEFFIVISLFLIFIFIDTHKILRAAETITIIILPILFLFYLFSLFSTVKNTTDSKTNPNELISLPNVYHLVLDGMQTDAFLNYVFSKNLNNNFSGFTLFENNISNYLYTGQSYASYVTGELYKKASYKEWWANGEKGLFKEVGKAGYQITAYAKGIFLPKHADHTISNNDIYASVTQKKYAYLGDFLSIVFARISINVWAEEALKLGKKLAGKIIQYVAPDKSNVKYPSTINEGIEPFTGVAMLKQSILDEPSRGNRGEYVYLHPIIPHGPYAIDDECQYYQPDFGNIELEKEVKSPFQKYYAQVKCAVDLVVDFLDQLNSLDRYHNSVIVIHSDHGHGHQGFLIKEGEKIISSLEKQKHRESFRKEYIGWSEEQIKARIMALLMIKPPNDKAPFTVNDFHSQLIDVYPTTANLLNLDVDLKQVDGIDLFDKKRLNTSRKQQFYMFKSVAQFTEIPELEIIEVFNPGDQSRMELQSQGLMIKYESVELQDEIKVVFGSNDGTAIISQGLSNIEFDANNIGFKWSDKKITKVTFPYHVVEKQQKVDVQFEAKPFKPMVGKVLTVRSALSTKEIKIEDKWKVYSAELMIPAFEELSIEFEYESIDSPKNILGTKDVRELGLRYRNLTILPTK